MEKSIKKTSEVMQFFACSLFVPMVWLSDKVNYPNQETDINIWHWLCFLLLYSLVFMIKGVEGLIPMPWWGMGLMVIGFLLEYVNGKLQGRR